ncbi:hypothetical protein [Nocardia donostiensis]|uniref:WXG100 family type VII secretion target n=1 Tax=Nocardia donostiensis TaxID=1538463 RepID=A0A1V2TM07_9NOCA|nr:hypothetical protein [Nocardia donostiensis]ONM50522.1 hypothetical protein B0T46_00990 [Nocardia donostiensis]OQS18171.1 hypothetical protein B0T44_21100 [Nocardia donostiensis]
MANTIEIDPELLRQAAHKTGHVRDRIIDALSMLDTLLAGHGAPWGHDKLGDRFANGPGGNDGYLAACKNLTTSSSNMATTFDGFAASHLDAATLLERQDHANGVGFR